MRKYFVILIFVLAGAGLFFILRADSSDKGDHDCIKCHKLTNEEAQNILNGGIPDARIIEVNPSPIKGLWEIVFETGKQKKIIYLDSQKKLLVSGAIFDVKNKINLTGDRLSELSKVDVSQIPLGDALVMGDKDAAKKVIVFTDPD